MTEAVPTDTSPIDFPTLAAFDMEMTPEMATYFLAVVRIPVCKKFRVQVDSPKNTFLPDALQHHTPTLASLVASGAIATISISFYGVFYEASGVVVCLLYPESLANSLTWIVNHLHPVMPSVPTRLTISTLDFPVTPF